MDLEEHQKVTEKEKELKEDSRRKVETLRKKVMDGVPVDAESDTDVDNENTEENENPAESAADRLNLPERSPEAMTGSEFAKYIEQMEKQTRDTLRAEGKDPNEILRAVIKQREEAIYAQIMAGNVPARMREFKNVEVEYTDPQSGEKLSGTIRVLPDYLMVGSDDDAIRITLTPAMAQIISRNLGCTLPTDVMVDAISAEARARGKAVQPHAMSADENMDSISTLARHNAVINEELGETEGNPLIDGTKKDIVIPYDDDGKGRVVIYGLHYKDGTLIQKYSNIHHDLWTDYSHGVRLVSGKMTVRYPDGTTRKKNVNEILRDPRLHHMIARKPINNPSRQYNEKQDIA